MEGERARVVIRGRVQGVCFRMETRHAALRLGGVTGWVKNRADGGVEAVFEGPREKVETMIRWCRHGPPLARVDAVDVNWESGSGGHASFEITY